MAGDWIKMRSNLWDDPRVARLVDLTNATEAAIVGGLYWLWSSADQHSEDGTMPGLTIKSIDRKTAIPGFGDALVTVGWLSDHPDGVHIARFDEHNGKSAKRRCAEAVRKMSARDADTMRTECTDLQQHCAPRGRERERGLPISPEIGLVGKPTVCPQSEIVSLYHQVLPSCTAVRDWTTSRQVLLRTRWNETPKRQSLDWWRKFFGYVSESEFLTGRAESKPDRDPFVADLEWLIRPKNFVKVIEGKYHSKAAA